MIILGLTGVGLIYVIYEMVKGDTKEVLDMIDDEFQEEEKLKKELNELKTKICNGSIFK